MEIKQLENNFDKLKAGCLFRSIQKENSEPENIALGQISKELRYLQRQFEYANEIDRVLKELRLTTFLIKECRVAGVPTGVNRQELLAYYQGVFLTLVHQMKDKVLQLVHMMTEEIVPEKPAIENDIKLSNLLNKKQKILRTIGIEEEIKNWDQENPISKIAVALRKRTHHHHRVSGLRYDKDFLNLGFTDIATQPNFQLALTDYGKQHIKKLRLESTEHLFSGALMKAEDTLKAIKENVEKISGALVNHFKLPISQEDAQKIITEQGKMMNSFKVVNRSSIDKVPEAYKELLKMWIEKVRAKSPEKVVAIYLVGSLGRGEYEEGYSDVNIYIIIDVGDLSFKILRDYDERFSLKLFTKAEFLSKRCQKYRVIAKADGVLVYGEDIIKDEKVPKAGLFLALILNDDILEILDRAKKWMEGNPATSQLEISKKSRKLAKRLIDFMYGVVMSNKPQYTASRKERIEKINEMYPENKNVVETLFGVSKYGIWKLESFKNLIEGFRSRAEMNLKKMQDVKAGIEKQDKLKGQ